MRGQEGPNEHSSAPTATVTLWAAAATSALRAALTAVDRLTAQVPVAVLGTVATLGGCLLWIPSSGIVGAAWALLLGRCLQACSMLAILLKARGEVFQPPTDTDSGMPGDPA